MPPRQFRILLVDSFLDEAAMFEAYLQCEGFEVAVCTEPARAWTLVVESAPDVVVTRLRPFQTDPNGLELTTQIKTHAATRGIPVVTITTSIRPGDREQALAAGCEAYLLLPCAPEDLVAELRRVLALADTRPRRRRRTAKASLAAQTRPRDGRKSALH